MRLTRRDAIAVLAGLGIVGGGAVAIDRFDPPTAESSDGDGTDVSRDDVVAVMVAAGEVVYPSETTGVAEFVETYVLGRTRDDERGEERGEKLRETIVDLDAVAREWYGSPFPALSRDERDSLLHELGTDTADPRADGPLSERIRFHVVNELLYAFYASPTGGRLVGIENPIGHPGGTESYQRATMGDEEMGEGEGRREGDGGDGGRDE